MLSTFAGLTDLAIVLDTVIGVGDKVGSIVGGSIALIGALGVAALWAKRRWTWRDPLQLCYLIPRGHYPRRDFPGAPEDEQTRSSLTVGIGEYLVVLRVFVKDEMLVDDAPWSFPGGDGAVEDLGSKNPFLVETRKRDDGRIHYLDWWGIWHNASTGPALYRPGVAWVTGHLIRTTKPFKGNLQVVFVPRGHKAIVKELPFVVDPEATDDIAFLKQDLISKTRW